MALDMALDKNGYVNVFWEILPREHHVDASRAFGVTQVVARHHRSRQKSRVFKKIED